MSHQTMWAIKHANGYLSTPLILVLQNWITLWSFCFCHCLPTGKECAVKLMLVSCLLDHFFFSFELNSCHSGKAHQSLWALLVWFSIPKSDQLQDNDMNMYLSSEGWEAGPGLGWIHQSKQPSIPSQLEVLNLLLGVRCFECLYYSNQESLYACSQSKPLG